MKRNLLFYDAYEQFYAMSASSLAFSDFCRDAYGQDFSQDGFSDVTQVDRLLAWMPKKKSLHVLDVGCGNGKMLRYIQQKTGAFIHGFDYAEHAIAAARAMGCENSDFRVGLMGEIDYPPESFDVVTSMDSMYFAPDMSAFVGQIRRWLKDDGLLLAGYQEGDVMPRTGGPHDTVLAHALRDHHMPYTAEDITAETYQLMHRKREAALRHQADLVKEGHEAWFQLLMMQTEHCLVSETRYRQENMRCLYKAHKEARLCSEW